MGSAFGSLKFSDISNFEINIKALLMRLKVNVDEDEVEELSLKFQVESIPTFVFFKDGKQLAETVQGANKAKIQQIYEANK